MTREIAAPPLLRAVLPDRAVRGGVVDQHGVRAVAGHAVDPDRHGGVGLLSLLWYAVVQAGWLKVALERSWPNTVLSTLWVLMLGIVINSLIGWVLLTS